jgi:hypothetical protein
MTTPDAPPDPEPAAQPDRPRAARPEPPRGGPRRGPRGRAAGAAGNPGLDDGGDPVEVGLREEVAQTVRVAYEVFAKNLEIGRKAASQFSQGEYRLGEVPHDLSQAAQEISRLLRLLFDTSVDIWAYLARELANNPPKGFQTPTPVPPFRPFTGAGAGAGSEPGPQAAASPLPLTVRFAGQTPGRALVSSLTRPQSPTSPADITVSPLLPRDRTAVPITEVTFDVDLASGGLTATVAAPDAQAPGVYSGVVWAATQDTPLGVLAIEIDP